MSSATLFVCCSLLLVLGATQGADVVQPREDIIACATKPGDQVLTLLQVRDEGHNLGKASLDVMYPPEGEPEENAINCIMATDLMPSTGAVASITNGTIGSSRVIIHLESSFTKGLSFSIKLMGQSL